APIAQRARQPVDELRGLLHHLRAALREARLQVLRALEGEVLRLEAREVGLHLRAVDGATWGARLVRHGLDHVLDDLRERLLELLPAPFGFLHAKMRLKLGLLARLLEALARFREALLDATELRLEVLP